MSVSITIPFVPDEVRNELRARAQRNGVSLEDYAREQLIELARRPDPELLVARMRERKGRTNSKLSAEELLHLRNTGRSD